MEANNNGYPDGLLVAVSAAECLQIAIFSLKYRVSEEPWSTAPHLSGNYQENEIYIFSLVGLMDKPHRIVQNKNWFVELLLE